MIESVDRRVLAAFRCFDAVSLSRVTAPVKVTSELRIRRNGSATYVVMDAPGMHDLTTDFDVPPAWPPPTAFDVSLAVSDDRYVSRRVRVNVPRKLAQSTDPDSVMVTQSVALYPSPAAPVSPNWAVVRVSVTQAGSGLGLPWSVAQITRADDGTVLGAGMGDERGEILLAVPGLGARASSSAAGAVVQSTIDAVVTAWFDPAVRMQPPEWLMDPDSVLQNQTNPNLKTVSQIAPIGRGVDKSLTMLITV